MDEVVSLVIPFIAIIFFVGMVENIVQALQSIFKRFRNEIIAFIIVFVLGTSISFSGDFRFFSYLGVDFDPVWVAHMMTGLVIASGSPFMEKKFDIINKIPMIIAGIRIGSNKNNSSSSNSNEPTI